MCTFLEIPHFLSDKECDYIQKIATDSGLSASAIFGKDINEEYKNTVDKSDIPRVSDQAWLLEKHVGADFLGRLQTR